MDDWSLFWPTNAAVLALSFAVLVVGTARVLWREARGQPPAAMLALALVWGGALALRLWLSPHTFLHEYYHIAETIPAHLSGQGVPGYGQTGPALFHAVATLLGRPADVRIIFVTNAVIASLAIPAVALLDLALMHSWPRALCAAILLAVLPQHLRFSAAEDLFVQAITFGFWALALFALSTHTRRLEDALYAALALSLAMQARPEMLAFPAVALAMVLLTEPRSWRVLFGGQTLLALALLAVLLIPRLTDMLQVVQSGAATASRLPDLDSYLRSLVILQAAVTPRLYWVLLAIGLLWGVRWKPGLVVWVALVFGGYTLFSLSLFDNAPFHLRAQTLPTAFLILIAAGAAPVWMWLWGGRRRLAVGSGLGALAVLAAVVVVSSRGFVTELRDQQLEWAFLERTVPRLPDRLTLLSAVEVGGRNLDVFPEFLLQRAGKQYQMVELRRVAGGEVPWPAGGDDLLFYQGMFCYFAFDDEPSPDPMAARCRAVHEHYVAEPLFVADLDTLGYSRLRYAPGPFRIGFFRLQARP